MSPDSNPYQPPAVDIPLPSTQEAGETEAIRKEHLSTETNIRSIGCLWMLSLPLAVFIVIGGAFPMILGDGTSGTLAMGGSELIFVAVLTVVMAMQGVVGIMLRKLNPAARVPAIILAAIGLIGFPLGTVISLFILLILCRAKGRRVLSPGYREIRAATPHIKYRTPVWLWVVLIIIVLALLAAIVLPFLFTG